MNRREVRYSLGFNFDPALIRGVIEANEEFGGASRIDEFFGALPDSPISSARPTSKLPTLSWDEFTKQILFLRDSQIAFNFLMNTAQRLDSALTRSLKTYLKRLADVGVHRLTVGTPELCAVVKDCFPRFHVTISITYGIHSPDKVLHAEAAGADAIYLDGVYVNRDFDLLRALLKQARVECRLYANMSCLSRCPVVGKHYAMFSGAQSESTSSRNDAFFAGCSMVKLSNPTEWLQMPWIRPEDVSAYASEGVGHFKLADRLAPTSTLLVIAQSYLKRKSPDNLFDLMERDGAKYELLGAKTKNQDSAPMYVHSKRLPTDFIEHFRKQGCKSNDPNCRVCVALTQSAVEVNGSWPEQLPSSVRHLVPLELSKRAGFGQ
jgi:collagenase-like PrtC family protease